MKVFDIASSRDCLSSGSVLLGTWSSKGNWDFVTGNAHEIF